MVVLCRVGQVSLNDGDFDNLVLLTLRHIRVHPERGNIDRLVIFILRHVRVRVLPEGDVHALMADVHYLVVLVGQDREPPE